MPASVEFDRPEEPGVCEAARRACAGVDAVGKPLAGAALALCTIDPPEGMREVEWLAYGSQRHKSARVSG